MQLNFDSTGIKPQGNLEPIPLNTYNVAIVDSGKSDTKANDGSAYLFFELKILDGPQASKVQSDRLNLWNKSPKTVEIAQSQLSAYCYVTGKYKFADTQEMHGIPFKARIGPQVAEDGTVSTKYSQVFALFHQDGSDPGKSTAAGAGTGAPPFAQAPPPAASTPSFGPPPVAAPAPPPPPAAPPAPPVPVAFPPAGWAAHPTAAGYFWMGTEVLTEAELRAKIAPPAAPAPPPAPPAAPSTPAFGAPPVPATNSAVPPWQQ